MLQPPPNLSPRHRRGTLALAILALLCGCDGAEVEVFSRQPDLPDTGFEPVFADQVDLLLVVDNSPSMADKQTVLALTVPDLVEGLTNPACVDAEGAFVTRPAAGTPCPAGSGRAFPPVLDLHIGVISSSLGGHGADACSDDLTTVYDPRMEDMAHLLTTDADDAPVPTYEDAGFLSWDPAQRRTPPGLSDAATLTQRFVNLVDGVGQRGCGFESTLEAWYRFLVDPAPYQRMVPSPCYGGDVSLSCREPAGIDMELLQQRRDFLRPTSLVGIVMLTDENDCSVKDGGQYYLALQGLDTGGTFHVARGTNACLEDPDSPDCRSCWEVFDYAQHPECQTGWTSPELQDPHNLRCFHQKQRFGIDFLQDTQRYVDGLTRATMDDGVMNPLFCAEVSEDGKRCSGPMRDPTQVVLAGIIGVPWQDIAKDPNDLSKGYVRWTDVPWETILGDPKAQVQPSDPLMIESVAARSGTNPATGSPLATPATPPDTPGANPINGFERDVPGSADLQYACIFNLVAPIDCQDPTLGCDCENAAINPVCWDAQTQQYGSMQYRGKAYPGLRHLEVLRGVGGVVASICPASLSDSSRRDYGYRPAVDALLERLRLNLTAR